MQRTTEISIGDTAALIAEVMGTGWKLSLMNNDLQTEASEVNRLYGSNSRLRELAGWEPFYGGLEGFRKVWLSLPNGLAIPTILLFIARGLCGMTTAVSSGAF